MKIHELFEREIGRTINPAVVVSNQKEETVDEEIAEYVFTDELIEKLYLILDTIVNKRSGKTGIWINGYYGSGKSHFIKYVHYCLQAKTREQAFEAYVQAVGKSYNTTRAGANMHITPSNIMLLQRKIQAINADNILFNVEDETDDGSGERMTRIFLNMLNKFRGYNARDIALAILLEKRLDNEGKFAAFKQRIDEELGFNWDKDAVDLAGFQLESILDIAQELVPNLDKISLHAKISDPDAYKITITETLIPELNKFLETKSKDYRLVFLVDEVSQYIGKNKDILLNLQSIIERISNDCNNQVWIACTAQQSLDDLVGFMGGDREDEFGKILGRFDTRISLQSNDASYITQKRVLDKKSIGLEALGKLYRQNKEYILNQFKISHDLYKGYQNDDDFTLAYPFVPYQFKLIAHVFEAFQQLQYVIKEVKDNERSVLGITHYTVKEYADAEVGGFIPFDAFYNGMFRSNLTHRGNRAIENALELDYVKKSAFAQRVVKALFMISNLLESQRMTFPSNLNNLTVLLMKEIDQNRMLLQKEIREVLDKLQEESIIREEKDNYFFFNEDEIDVQNLIKNQSIGLDERLERFDGLFRKLAKIERKHKFGQNDFTVGFEIDRKEILRNGDFNIVVLFMDATPVEQKALELKKNDLGICVNEWFLKDENLRRDFEWYCKTLKFFTAPEASATATRAKTIENFRIRNATLLISLEQRLEEKYASTRFISQQRILSADQINGVKTADRTKNSIDKHLEGIYHKHQLATNYAQTQLALKASAADSQMLLPNLSPAEEAVNSIITHHNDQMTVHDLVNEQEKAPFGWRPEATLDVLVHLVKKKKREFRYNNQPRYPIIDFINKAVSTMERPRCVVCSGQEIDQATLDETSFAFRDIFNRDLTNTTDGNELYQFLLVEFKKEQALYQPLEDEFHGTYPFGNSFHEVNKQLNSWIGIRDPKALFNAVCAEKDSAKVWLDKAKGIRDFAHQFRKDYDIISQFYRDNRENLRELNLAAQEKAEKIAGFLQLEDPRNEFRHIRKAYDELKQDLQAYRQDLLNEVLQVYEQVFVDLEAEQQKRGIKEANLYADRDYTLQSISKLESITQLKNKLLSANDFKEEQLEALISYAASRSSEAGAARVGEPELYYITKLMTTISNERELDDYLQKAREEMLQLLRQNKTIIIK